MDWVGVGYLVFIGINAVDGLLTHRILQFGGREFNWLMRLVYSRWGLRGLITLKTTILILMGWTCVAGRMDLYTIWYLNFMFTVVLIAMAIDMRVAGCPIFSSSNTHSQTSPRGR